MEECKHEFIGHDGFVECIKCGARLTAEEYRELKNKVKVPPIGKRYIIGTYKHKISLTSEEIKMNAQILFNLLKTS